VSAEHNEVGIPALNIHRRMRNRLSRIHQHMTAVFMRKRRPALNRIFRPQRVAGGAEGKQLGANSLERFRDLRFFK